MVTTIKIEPSDDGMQYAAIVTIRQALPRTTTLAALDELSVVAYRALQDVGVRTFSYATVFAQHNCTIIQVDVEAPPPPNGERLLDALHNDEPLNRLLRRLSIAL